MSEDDRFQQAPGLPGKLFVPCCRGGKKHPCPECFECQWCSDARCASCRGGCCRRGDREREEEPEG